jgi:FMN-dependent NADH-azoreductase
MTKLLFVQASPRKADSKSILLAQTYLTALQVSNPDLDVDILEVWDADLPAFDGDKAAAKMNVVLRQDNDAVQQQAWEQIVEIANRFISADRYLFAVPMWNGGIPYRLKQYIDLIHQPGLLWGIDPTTGYYGMLKNKHATVALTSGVFGSHPDDPAFGVDHHASYLRSWLNQAGVTDIDEIKLQPSTITPDPAAALEEARKNAIDLAHAQGRI